MSPLKVDPFTTYNVLDDIPASEVIPWVDVIPLVAVMSPLNVDPLTVYSVLAETPASEVIP
jgi:hypothetical protein